MNASFDDEVHRPDDATYAETLRSRSPDLMAFCERVRLEPWPNDSELAFATFPRVNVAAAHDVLVPTVVGLLRSRTVVLNGDPAMSVFVYGIRKDERRGEHVLDGMASHVLWKEAPREWQRTFWIENADSVPVSIPLAAIHSVHVLTLPAPSAARFAPGLREQLAARPQRREVQDWSDYEAAADADDEALAWWCQNVHFGREVLADNLGEAAVRIETIERGRLPAAAVAVVCNLLRETWVRLGTAVGDIEGFAKGIRFDVAADDYVFDLWTEESVPPFPARDAGGAVDLAVPDAPWAPPGTHALSIPLGLAVVSSITLLRSGEARN